MKVEYSSNNSGGRWWLTDENWKALEEAGWTVTWIRDRCRICYQNRNDHTDVDHEFITEQDGRWLGALATVAYKEFPTVGMAVAEWEYVTGKRASDSGCRCCGQPHLFSGRSKNGTYHYS